MTGLHAAHELWERRAAMTSPARKTKRRAPAREPAPPRTPRPGTTNLLEGFGPVRWSDTAAELTRTQGLTRSSLVGWHALPEPWALSTGEPWMIEVQFHDSGRLLRLRATWSGDEDGSFVAWESGEAPRVFEALLASMGCTLTGPRRFQSDPARAGQLATLAEGDGDDYQGPGDVGVSTFLNYDPPEFVLTFERR